MLTNLILAAVFVSVIMAVFAISNYLISRREIQKNVEVTVARRSADDLDVIEFLGNESDTFRYYFDTVRNAKPDSIELRLVQAGYFGRDAVRVYNRLRLMFTTIVFAAAWYFLTPLLASANAALAPILSACIAAISFILQNAILDNIISHQQIRYRRLFPDFLDLLIVCVDAGMSIEAALDRVATELQKTEPTFGHHVAIINLEIRAGRPLAEALVNFANRIKLDEARSMAVLFRQSQELGSSVVKTLRVFADEMRRFRLLAAEEKANALPVKMLFPMAGFLFPINIIIVLIPILISIMKFMGNITPGAIN